MHLLGKSAQRVGCLRRVPHQTSTRNVQPLPCLSSRGRPATPRSSRRHLFASHAGQRPGTVPAGEAFWSSRGPVGASTPACRAGAAQCGDVPSGTAAAGGHGQHGAEVKSFSRHFWLPPATGRTVRCGRPPRRAAIYRSGCSAARSGRLSYALGVMRRRAGRAWWSGFAYGIHAIGSASSWCCRRTTHASACLRAFGASKVAFTLITSAVRHCQPHALAPAVVVLALGGSVSAAYTHRRRNPWRRFGSTSRFGGRRTPRGRRSGL